MKQQKPLSKAEVKARKAEANAKNYKKRDFRKLANEMFKNPTDHLPLISHGFGAGTTTYCYKCRGTATKTKTTYEDGNKVTLCRTCGGTDVEVRPKDASIVDKIKWRYKEFIYGRQHKK